MFDVALEVPLVLFSLGGLGERDHAGVPDVDVFVEALDSAAFTGGIAALEDNEVASFIVHRPVLEFQ